MESVLQCDNVRACHNPEIACDANDGMRVICKDCKHTYIIRKDPYKGTPDMRAYIKIFARDTLQGKDNLFYRYYPQHLRI